MRWSISTSTKEKKIEGTNNKYKQITTTTKKQYITIGDIVGYGKSFSGAVKTLCKTLPTMIKSMNKSGNTSGAAIAQSALSIATPLSAVIKGTEIYKKITRVSNIVNPIFKTVARLTGVWNSPGNALDIAQITVGVVQQILVGIIVAAIIGLKNKIWNYELPIDETSEETSVIITKNVTDSAAKINGTVISNLTTANLNLAPGYSTEEQQQLEDIYNAINERVGTIYPATKNFTEEIAKAMKQEVSEEAEENKLYNDSWITDYTLEETNRFRELRGSINNKGIQYSDVEEEGNIVWKDSNITTGNFCCFAKLETGSGNTVYLAGSEPFMTEESIASTSDTSWSMDANNHYNKDYYGDDLVKYTKYYKDNNEISIDARVRRNSVKGAGIYYSIDNGVTWQQSYIIDEYIGNMLELEEKDDGNGGTIPARVVASSYDYHGLWYSEDGISWTKSIMINEDETEENITTDRYVCFGTSECKRYRINTSEIVVEPECYFKTFTGINPEQHPDDDLVVPIIEGDGTNPYSIVRRIMDYLHEELPRSYWLSKSEEFLDELISKIQSNNLTVDDFYGVTEETLDEFVEGGN